MAEVYAFPVKQQLTQEVEECLHELAVVYIKTLSYAMETMCIEDPDDAEFGAIMELIITTFVKDLEKAIDELES